MEKYVKLLKENTLKVTPQRLSILKFLDKNRTHPTVEDIYSALKKNHPSLSKTTVYNSLETLKNHGIIQALTICGSEFRYDIRYDSHHHFLCKKCGEIIDIDLSCPNIEKVSNYGHNIDEVHGYFKGICRNCIEKECD